MYFAGYKENNTLNKVLFICLLAFVFVLISISPVFANFTVTCSNGYSTSIPDLPDNPFSDYLVHFHGNSVYLYYFNYDENNPPNYLFEDNGIGGFIFYLTNQERYFYLLNANGSWSLRSTGSTSYGSGSNDFKGFYSTCNVYDYNSHELLNPKFYNPSFITSKEELETGKFEALKISAGSLSNLGDSLILNIYNSTYIGDNIYSDIKYKSFMLDEKSSYWNAWDLVYTYVIPREKLGIDISNGKRYIFELVSIGEKKTYDKITFTIGGLEVEDEIKNKQDEQTEAIKENTETNKGIWETIKDILSYINPFSDNFFVYKLIELLVDAIKSLFIPSDDFFSTYFTDLKNWFSDRLGFLFYPFELIIDILSKILNINFSDPIFNIPDLYEPFTNSKLISATTFNLNSMLENNIFSTLHNIYLICVDAFIVFELVNLFKKKYEEVTTK